MEEREKAIDVGTVICNAEFQEDAKKLHWEALTRSGDGRSGLRGRITSHEVVGDASTYWKGTPGCNKQSTSRLS